MGEEKTNAQTSSMGKVETRGTGTGSYGRGTGSLNLPNVGGPSSGGTRSGTGTVTSPSGNRTGPSDKSRSIGGMRSPIGTGPSNPTGTDQRTDSANGQPGGSSRGTGSTGIREGSGGNAGGTGRQGGDSRKRDETIGAPEDVLRVKSKKEKPDAVPFLIQEGGTKGKKADLKPEMIAYGVEGFFATVGGLTNHDWWEVTPLEADSVAQPLTRILNRMDPLQRQLFERYFDPAMLLLAVGMVVVPRLKAEMYLREEERKQSLEKSRPSSLTVTVPAGEPRQKNENAGPDAIFRRNGVVEHFRQRSS